ncbi:MAG TPA: phosphatase PAP2 family protein [Candidatus Eisenbacteria bacterium]|nr:phosphatase PAP2 family protein [Candidatus Eisenbacteria bacterium]
MEFQGRAVASCNVGRFGRQHYVATGTAYTIALMVVLASCAFGQQAPPPGAQTTSPLPDAPSATQQAQHSSFRHGVATAARTIGQDEWHLISAPFTAEGLSFGDGVPFYRTTLFWSATIVTATGVLIANDESVAQQVPVSWHQTGVNISDACTYSTAAAAGGIYLTGLFTHNEHAQRTGVLAAEATVDSFLLYGGMKLIFNRERPYTSYDGKFFAGNFSSGSFPSGHAALAWTLASVVAHEYPRWPVELAMYGLATTVATTRVTGGQHFPSDVFVGSTLGYLVGRYVANKDKRAQTAHAGSRLKRMPEAILGHVVVQ